MMYVRTIAALFAVFLASPAVAQYQTPVHTIPIGKGGTNTGFNAAAPGNTSYVLRDNGASQDPSFGPLPFPSATSLGGVFSVTCAAHNWVSVVSSLGVPSCTQPAFADVSGTVSLSQGGLGGSQQAATVGQVPVFPGSGLAAVPTSLGYVNVVAYGADPTGVSDSTTAIQNAITAANGGLVYIPGGVFKVSAINVSTQGTTIRGAGRLSTVIHETNTTATTFNISVSYVEISDLSIVGTSGVIQTAGTAINANGSQGCRFTNLYISDLYAGIVLNNSTNCLVQFVKMLDMYGLQGITTTNGGGDYIINNQLDPLFWSSTVYSFSSGYGAWVANHAYSAGAVVSNASGWFVAQTGGTSAASGGGPQITAFGTLVSDGTVRWYFIGATNASGIQASSVSNSNFIAFNDVSGPWSQGIQILGSDNNIIIGNTVGQTIGLGIQLGTNATNTYIAENLFSGMLYTFGIGVSDNNGSAAGTHVVNNRFNGAGWHCILLQGSADWVITGNQITGCGAITGANGIDVISPTTDFVINSNIIIPSAGQTNAIAITAGASDYYSITTNGVHGATISDGGTGTHKTVSSNN